MHYHNPVAFLSGPVSIWTTVVYAVVLISIVLVHVSVPPPPSGLDADAAVRDGLDVDAAWRDLAELTRYYHPYNSRNNDEIRAWLFGRIQEVLQANGVEYSVSQLGGLRGSTELYPAAPRSETGPLSTSSQAVTIFDDLVSNVTFYKGPGGIGTNLDPSGASAAYFEGTNLAVYIRGREDPNGPWWETTSSPPLGDDKWGVLVNAHYDSVSTGRGATDDGMGCVSVLQLISHFTLPGKQPKRGIVVLLNNNEEEGLFGAQAFGYSPLLPFCHAFVNLEGAGGGGRAVLFRSTDLQITQAYQGSPHPFGTVVGADAFKLGVVRSGTDYSIFYDVYGQRGVDIAFYTPRYFYHTDQDDTRHASRASLWHMVSAAVATVENLVEGPADAFAGPRPDEDSRKVQNGAGKDGVWFDIFGSFFIVFELRTLFAWSLVALIVAPIVLIIVYWLLVRLDRCYLFSHHLVVHPEADHEPVMMGGWKGVWRFPIALAVASFALWCCIETLVKINPLFVYDGEYIIWATMFSLTYIALWAPLKVASVVRPSALQRAYVHIWLFVLGWALLVAAAVLEDRHRIAGVYPFLLLEAALFLSTLVALLDLLALQPRRDFARDMHDNHQALDQALASSLGSGDTTAGAGTRPYEAYQVGGGTSGTSGDDDNADEPTETTPLTRGEPRHRHSLRTTFATTYRRSIAAIAPVRGLGSATPLSEHEQKWSGRLPSWTWLVQLLILVPVPVIIFGQLGLFMVTAVSGTGADGSNLATPYVLTAVISMMILLPLAPFIHRVGRFVPFFLAAVFVCGLVYSLFAFPFSARSPYKFYFKQTWDLDSGDSNATVIGLEKFVRVILDEIPAAAGQDIQCRDGSTRASLATCYYNASSVLPQLTDGGTSNSSLAVARGSFRPADDGGLIDVQISYPGPEAGHGKVTIQLHGANTRLCKLRFDRAIAKFTIRGGAGVDDRFGKKPKSGGVHDLTLYRRDRSRAWVVDVEWAHGNGGGGVALCMWDDANVEGTVPAFDEMRRYAPAWSIVSKQSPGLVEASKRFSL